MDEYFTDLSTCDIRAGLSLSLALFGFVCMCVHVFVCLTLCRYVCVGVGVCRDQPYHCVLF